MSDVDFNFSGKNFAVFGASSGMGNEIAIELANSGAKVFSIGRDVGRLEKLKSHNPENIIPCSFDVVNRSNLEWQNLASSFVDIYGKLDGVVYTAGISCSTPLRMYDETRAKNVMEISFWSAIKMLQVFSKKKYSNIGSSFVLFASVAAHSGEKGIFAYSATKSALISAVKSVCHDMAKDGHRVNTISPGYVQTSMTETVENNLGFAENVVNRHLLGIGTPSDVSGLVLFLLSNRAKWITGSDFVIDGGYLNGAYK